MNPQNVTFFLSFLKDVEVTGKDEPPAIESVSYGTEHLGFLGNSRAKLTGKVAMIVNTEDGEVIPIYQSQPKALLIQLEVISPEETFWVLAHRIQFVTMTGPMTIEGVYVYIDAQTQWTDEEKRALKGLYQGYVNVMGAPKTSPRRLGLTRWF